MIVGVDASNIRSGGGVTHLVELLRAAVPQRHGIEKVVVWGGSETLAKLQPQDWLYKIHDSMLDRGMSYRVVWQYFKLEKLAKQARCDVLFVPGGSHAGNFRPIVSMSQNLLPFERTEMRRYGMSWLMLKNLLLRLVQTRTFRKADGIIFLTPYAHNVVMKVVGRQSGSIAVIPHGIDARFFCAPRRQFEVDKRSIEKPYFRLLYVSNVDVYKHQWHVIEAVAELRASGLPVHLDLVGPGQEPALSRMNEVLRRADPGGRFIRYWGAVPYEELHLRYAAADINVFASSCENMPNTLLEGMAAGLPIACSRRGPMPEVLGDAGMYFDPERPDEIAGAIRTLIESPELRMGKAKAAFERAQQFSWSRCADETFGFLAGVCRAKA